MSTEVGIKLVEDGIAAEKEITAGIPKQVGVCVGYRNENQDQEMGGRWKGERHKGA